MFSLQSCPPNAHAHTTIETISYGRAAYRQISREKGHLSYPAGAIVTVFAKAVGGDSELWEAEVGKAVEATLSTLSVMHSVHMV